MTDRLRGLWPRYLSESQFANLFLVPLVLFLLLTAIFPLSYSAWIALNDVSFGLDQWRFVGLENFLTILTAEETWHGFFVSMIYMTSTTFLSVSIGLAGALLLNEKFRGNRALMWVMILPMALSNYGTAILFRYIFAHSLGMLNVILQHVGLVDANIQFITASTAIFMTAIAHSWKMAPFTMSFYLAALQVIPPDMYRVARVDRLGVFGRFRHVTLPYLKGTLLATAALVMIAAVKVFDVIYFMTNGGPGDASTTLTFEIYSQTFVANNYGEGAALSWFLVAIVMVLLIGYFVMYLREHRRVRT